MKLTINQKQDIQILVSLALHAEHKKIEINSIKGDINNILIINLSRNMSISELRKLKNYFNLDKIPNIIKYTLKIVFNKKQCRLHIENICSNQISFFSLPCENDLWKKKREYDMKINKELIQYTDLMFNIFKTDELSTWTFYYISWNYDHIGFANADKKSRNSYKVFKEDFKKYINIKNADFYKYVLPFKGTLNDAKIMCIKRNHNSECGGDWDICEYGVPINELL